MKRLTIKYHGQSVLKELCGFDSETNKVNSCKTCAAICKHIPLCNTCAKCPIQISFERLAAYEKTGLSPKQVRRLKKKFEKNKIKSKQKGVTTHEDMLV